MRAALEFEARKRAAGGEPAATPASSGRVEHSFIEDATLFPTKGLGALTPKLQGGKKIAGSGQQSQSDVVQELNERYGPNRQGASFGGMFDAALVQYRALRDEMTKPVKASVEVPRAGPVRQRMSRHVEQQRERDVTRMSRHASHSDIGFS
jgi:hypothetical protein